MEKEDEITFETHLLLLLKLVMGRKHQSPGKKGKQKRHQRGGEGLVYYHRKLILVYSDKELVGLIIQAFH